MTISDQRCRIVDIGICFTVCDDSLVGRKNFAFAAWTNSSISGEPWVNTLSVISCENLNIYYSETFTFLTNKLHVFHV